METKGFFQFEIIINILASYFRFIWIPMLWVYDLYKYFNSYSAGTVYRRQNLTSSDGRFWRLKTVHEYSRFYSVLLANSINVIENEMCVKTSRFANGLSQFKQILVIFTHLKLWVAVASTTSSGSKNKLLMWRFMGYCHCRSQQIN